MPSPLAGEGGRRPDEGGVVCFPAGEWRIQQPAAGSPSPPALSRCCVVFVDRESFCGRGSRRWWLAGC